MCLTPCFPACEPLHQTQQLDTKDLIYNYNRRSLSTPADLLLLLGAGPGQTSSRRGKADYTCACCLGCWSPTHCTVSPERTTGRWRRASQRPAPLRHIPKQVGGRGEKQGGALTKGECGHRANLVGIRPLASFPPRPDRRQGSPVKIAHAGGTRTAGPSTLLTLTTTAATRNNQPDMQATTPSSTTKPRHHPQRPLNVPRTEQPPPPTQTTTNAPNPSPLMGR